MFKILLIVCVIGCLLFWVIVRPRLIGEDRPEAVAISYLKEINRSEMAYFADHKSYAELLDLKREYSTVWQKEASIKNSYRIEFVTSVRGYRITLSPQSRDAPALYSDERGEIKIR